MKNYINEDDFEILKKIDSEPNVSQRDLSHKLNMSLGKINYCLKALKSKGLRSTKQRLCVYDVILEKR